MFRVTHHLITVALLGLVSAAPLCAQKQQAHKPQKRKAIAGQVMDAEGKPAAGVTVKLSSGPYPGLPKVVHDFLPHRGPAFEVVTRTNDRGRFRITAPNRH
ncbi:MAG: carboxypeptidase-like regulatory domain-containing protein, partial [Planctomycetota bacterium]